MLSRSCSAPVLGSLVSALHPSETLKGGVEADFTPPIWTSCKLPCKSSGCVRLAAQHLSFKGEDFEGKAFGSQRFRRAQSENNLQHSSKRMEETDGGIGKGQRSGTMLCSRMNGLVLAADGVLGSKGMACYSGLDDVKEEDSDDLEISEKPAENSTPGTQIQPVSSHSPQESYNESIRSWNGNERGHRQRTHMNIGIADGVEGENPLASRIMSENFKMVDGEKYSTVAGVALACSARGSNPAPVYEYELGDGFGIGRGAGNGMSGGGRGGGGGGGSSGADSNSTDTYYQKMLEANPGNPLLLRNYAKYLHEIQHDMKKAEEYYGRAILASPGDGDVLSLYAKLIWEGHRDASRAKTYFDQAVQAAPDDCYVLASYAHFLWNSEDGEENNDDPDLQHEIESQTFLGSAAAATC